MNVGESFALKGELKIRVHDLDGILIDEVQVNNLIVNTGKTSIVKLLGGDAAYKNLEHITKMAFGTSNQAAAAGDVALIAAQFEKAVTVSYPAFNKVMFSCTMEGTEGGSHIYAEIGLKTNATEKLFSRVVIAPITKSALYKISVDWTISVQ